MRSHLPEVSFVLRSAGMDCPPPEVSPQPTGRPRNVCSNLLRSLMCMWSKPATPAICVAVFLNF